MADDIKLVVGVDYRELTGLIKTADQTKRTLSSVAKEFVRTGDQKQYMASINRIVQAQKQLDSTSQMTRSKIMKLGAQMQQEVKFTNALTAATQRLSVAQKSSNKVLQQTKNRMNGNNMAIQQLGYQMGDFAVQVQGGTSAFVAFSQQGAQLAGILPSIAGPLGLTTTAAVNLSAALGIGIPVFSAAGRFLYEMATGAKKAGEEVKTFSEELDETNAVIGRAKDSLILLGTEGVDRLTEKYGILTTGILNLAEAMADVEVSAMQDRVNKTLADFFTPEKLDIISGKLGSVGQALLEATDSSVIAENIAEIQREINALEASKASGAFFDANILKEYKEELALLQGEFDKAGSLGEELGSVDQATLEDFRSLEAAIKSAVKEENFASAADRIQELRELFKSLGIEVSKGDIANLTRLESTLRLAQASTTESLNDVAAQKAARKVEESRLKLQGEAFRNRRKQNQEARTFYNEESASLKASNELLGEKIIFGKEDFGVKQLIREQTLKAYEAELKREGLGEDLIADLVSQKTAALDLALLLERAEAADLRRSKIKFSNLSMSDAMLALQYQAMGESKANAPKKPPKAKGTGGGAKESPQEKLAKYLQGKQQELTLEEKLVGVFDEERQIQTELFNIKEKYAGVITPQQEKELENILRLTEAEKERQAVIEEAQAERLALENSITQAMETGFMAMIDGTMSVKDAFKSMAAAIIKELIQVMVVQKAVAGLQMIFGGGGLFGGASWSANGDVVGSSGIQAYADGGVVGGPTMFQHGGGLGVMGEAGPEAIMPLKRGANGKLGVQMEGSGGGDTYVTNNYSISANTSEDTKRLVTQTIQQATPTITANTKASIMNDRRRGGQMKSVFG
jgi:hypothetical protein